ncbi:15255_t:CDS:2 [Dentiscutata erythropus]|uniref:15255_t:CDS:1 n=1 Tax=Dentiscutata erythropus TaxID=1348616 RepID=A0A9N9FRE8_9GLOM|nr:15255_t:CDS:2 [Dentiscutata erythropus]
MYTIHTQEQNESSKIPGKKYISVNAFKNHNDKQKLEDLKTSEQSGSKCIQNLNNEQYLLSQSSQYQNVNPIMEQKFEDP